MGPFKHKVDDGLEIRKSAFECMLTLIETCLDRIDIYALLGVVIKGLSDPSPDIKMLCHLMLQRLAILSPTTVFQRLDDVIEPLRETLFNKLKTTAVKQEIEKNTGLIRSAARTVLLVQKSLSNDLSSSAQSVRFEQLIKEVKGDELSSVLVGILNEVEGNGTAVSMDIS